MKIIISDEAKSRLTNASANGSIIASDILNEIRKNQDVSDCIKGTANYFKTKRKKQNDDYAPKIKIVFSVCTKDITNENFPDKNNPQAPWFEENRTEVDPSTFINYFKNLPEYTDEQKTYFANAICIDTKITVKTYSQMSDIFDAYNGDNYMGYRQYGNSSLHGSCMRDETLARNAADFYYNFAGAKIIVARDIAGNVCGRAILWEKAKYKLDGVEHDFSILDRIYTSHDFIIDLICKYAKTIGVNLRKTKNDFNSKQEFTVLNEHPEVAWNSDQKITGLNLFISVPASKWHKVGAPYMDTFSYLCVSKDNGLILTNSINEYTIAVLESTSGYGGKNKYFCPKCGKVNNSRQNICEDCFKDIFIETEFGRVMLDKPFTYQNKTYPASLFKRGLPDKNLQLYLQLQKIY